MQIQPETTSKEQPTEDMKPSAPSALPGLQPERGVPKEALASHQSVGLELERK